MDRHMTKDEAIDKCVGLIRLSFGWRGIDLVENDDIRNAFDLLLESENFRYLQNVVVLEEWERAGLGWPQSGNDELDHDAQACYDCAKLGELVDSMGPVDPAVVDRVIREWEDG